MGRNGLFTAFLLEVTQEANKVQGKLCFAAACSVHLHNSQWLVPPSQALFKPDNSIYNALDTVSEHVIKASNKSQVPQMVATWPKLFEGLCMVSLWPGVMHQLLS